MKIKKLFLLLFFTTIVITETFANDWLSYGNYSITWYNKNSKEYTINSEKELAGIAYLVNNGYTTFKGKTIKIAKNLNLRSYKWIPIGYDKNNNFAGTLDGQNHTINGIEITSTDLHYYGFIGYMNAASIKNLDIVVDIDIKDFERYVGGLAGYAENCTFSHCIINGGINYSFENPTTAEYEFYIGQMVGKLQSSKISYCDCRGIINITLGASTRLGYYTQALFHIGGLVGYDFCSSIERCSSGSLRKSSFVGAGSYNSGPTLNIGGIVGTGQGSEIISCSNYWNSSINYYGAYNTKGIGIYYGGIAGYSSVYYDVYLHKEFGGIYNCYSSITEVNGDCGSTEKGYIEYGAIAADYSKEKTNNYKANYSTADFNINIKNTRINGKRGYNGNTSFFYKDMPSEDFCNEMNIYPIIEYGEAVWEQITPTSYPSIINMYETTGIKETIQTNNNYKIINRNVTFNNPVKLKVITLSGNIIFNGYTDKIVLAPNLYIIDINGNRNKICIQ